MGPTSQPAFSRDLAPFCQCSGEKPLRPPPAGCSVTVKTRSGGCTTIALRHPARCLAPPASAVFAEAARRSRRAAGPFPRRGLCKWRATAGIGRPVISFQGSRSAPPAERPRARLKNHQGRRHGPGNRAASLPESRRQGSRGATPRANVRGHSLKAWGPGARRGAGQRAAVLAGREAMVNTGGRGALRGGREAPLPPAAGARRQPGAVAFTFSPFPG